MFGQTLANIWQVATDWALAILGGIGTVMSAIGTAIFKNHKRSKENKRRLEGDADNPNHEGVLEIAADNNEKLDHLESQQEDVKYHLEQLRASLDDDDTE